MELLMAHCQKKNMSARGLHKILKVARTIADETGSTAMQIQTLHNLSKTDFDNGETWVSLMRRNIEVLRKALQ